MAASAEDDTASERALRREAPETEPGVLASWRFKIAVLAHHRAVYRVANAVLRDAAEAEDVTQEVFLRYWQAGAAVERPREWLLKVARNASLDRLRRTKRLVSNDDGAAAEHPDDRDPAWHYEQRELGAHVRSALARMAEPQRSLIVMFDMQGVDGKTCAAVLGLNANQVKVYLHRARRRLRILLEQSS